MHFEVTFSAPISGEKTVAELPIDRPDMPAWTIMDIINGFWVDISNAPQYGHNPSRQYSYVMPVMIKNIVCGGEKGFYETDCEVLQWHHNYAAGDTVATVRHTKADISETRSGAGYEQAVARATAALKVTYNKLERT